MAFLLCFPWTRVALNYKIKLNRITTNWYHAIGHTNDTFVLPTVYIHQGVYTHSEKANALMECERIWLKRRRSQIDYLQMRDNPTLGVSCSSGEIYWNGIKHVYRRNGITNANFIHTVFGWYLNWNRNAMLFLRFCAILFDSRQFFPESSAGNRILEKIKLILLYTIECFAFFEANNFSELSPSLYSNWAVSNYYLMRQ